MLMPNGLLGAMMPPGMGDMMAHPVKYALQGGFTQHGGGGGPQIGEPASFESFVGNPGSAAASLSPRGMPGQPGLVRESNPSSGGPYSVTHNDFSGSTIGAGKADVDKVLSDRKLADNRANGTGSKVVNNAAAPGGI